jgi:5-methylthioadenosine/S-adenosylhomocysteine deaminase
VPLMTWLQQHIWPAEAKHVSDEFVHDGSLLAMAEMIRAGVTCVNDMYFFPEATARAALRMGMRASLGVIAIEFPSAYAPDAAGYLQKGLAARDAFRGETLLSFCLAPHAPYTVGDEMLRRMAVLAEEIDVPIHCHVHETPDEIAQGLAKDGVRPFERLRRLGVVGPRLIAVHAVHMEEGELDVMAREGVSIAHCPSSNLKLASGMAPVARMRARGIRVGLGTDGAASNNRLDLLMEARMAALLAKAASGNAAALPAHEALEMATIEPARALGLDERIGSIAEGKAADLAAVELSSLETLPCYDPVSHLVYAAGRENVTHVWINGRQRLAERKLVDIDERGLEDKARWWQKRLTA